MRQVDFVDEYLVERFNPDVTKDYSYNQLCLYSQKIGVVGTGYSKDILCYLIKRHHLLKGIYERDDTLEFGESDLYVHLGLLYLSKKLPDVYVDEPCELCSENCILLESRCRAGFILYLSLPVTRKRYLILSARIIMNTSRVKTREIFLVDTVEKEIFSFQDAPVFLKTVHTEYKYKGKIDSSMIPFFENNVFWKIWYLFFRFSNPISYEQKVYSDIFTSIDKKRLYRSFSTEFIREGLKEYNSRATCSS